jgi:phosphoglycerate dehydrogenase-like enzyme
VIDASGRSKQLLSAREDVGYAFIGPALEPQDLGEVEALFIWDFATSFLRDNWPRFGRLRWVHVAAAGVEGVLFGGLARSDVVLTNSRHVFDRAMAEYALGLMLCMAKDFRATLRFQAEHTWSHRETETLAGRALVVVGVGPIARATARLARAFGMRVLGVGRSARLDDPDFGDVLPSTRLSELLPEADYLLLVAPHTPATEGLVGREALARLRPSARVINLGRASILDEVELRRALVEGRIAGAALDVFESEPLSSGHPLWDVPNLLLSPHMAGDAVGWREAVAGLFDENLRRWLSGQPLLNVVDKALGYVAPRAQGREDQGGDSEAADE